MLGIAAGSFSNNLISFFSGKSDFDMSRSSCMCGREKLSTPDLIPIISFLVLKGRCRYCSEKLPRRYLLTELFSGAAGLLCFMSFGWTLITIIHFISFIILLNIAFIDIKKLLIPNVLTLCLLAVSAVKLALSYSQEYYLFNIISAILISAILLLINYLYFRFREKTAIGAGDIKLIFVLFLLIDFPVSFIALWLSALIALPGIYLLGMFNVEYSSREKVPFGFFLALGFIITSLCENAIMTFYNSFIAGV